MNKIRLSCAYAFPICKYGYPPSFPDLEKALREIAAMGYRHCELEGLGPAHNRHFTARRKFYQQLGADLGLHFHNYCIVDPTLVSPTKARRRKAYELYDRGCENAAVLGAETIHIASYTPPVRFRKIPYKLKETYSFDLDYRATIPRGFDWEASWSILVESCRRAAETADRFGLDVLVEPRVGEMVAGTDAMLLLLRDVNHPRLKANFDFAHLMAQKEILALSWKKLEPHIGGVHVADNDTASVDHLPIGKGKVDWETMLKLIASGAYNRYLGVDLFVPPARAIPAFREARILLEDMVRKFGLGRRIAVSGQAD